MRYCSKCGNELNDDQVYCPKCGNKEPFVTNSENSSWKDFEEVKRVDGNVNYDFKNQKVVQDEGDGYPKAVKGLKKANIIFSSVCACFFIATFVLSIIFTILGSKSNYFVIQILNYVGLGLFVINLILSIVQIGLLSKSKIKISGSNSPEVAVIVVSVVGIIVGIIQIFLLSKTAMAGLMCLQFMLMLSVPLTLLQKIKKSRK